MGSVRPASATSKAFEVLLKVWDVLHPRAVGMWANAASGGEGGASERSELTAGGLAVAAEGSRLQVIQ